jgi:hypothetical protein
MFNREGYILVATNEVPNHMIPGKTFTNQTELVWLNEANEVAKTIGCNICFEQFPTSQGAGQHIGRVHNGTQSNKKSDNSISVLAKEITRLEREVERWKKEARVANSKLRALGKAFGRSL